MSPLNIFDLLPAAMEGVAGWAHPFFALGVLSFALGIVGALLYQRLTDQAQLAATTRLIRCAQLEARLSVHEPRALFRAQGKLLKLNGRYFAQSAKAMGIIILVMVGAVISFDSHFAFAPIRPGEIFTVSMVEGKGRGVDMTLDRSVPLVGVTWVEDDPLLHRVVFRAGATAASVALPLLVNGQPVAKQVVIAAEGIPKITKTLPPPGLFDYLYQTETGTVPEGVAGIQVNYEELLSPIPLFGWRADWIWFFLIVSLGSLVILKKALSIN